MVTAANASSSEVTEELAILEANADPARASLNRYWNDLVATGIVAGEKRSLRFDPSDARYRFDRISDPPRTRSALLARLAVGDVLTFEGVVPGRGIARGGDRDSDGILDGDESSPSLGIEAALDSVRVEWRHEGDEYFLESRALSPRDLWLPEARVIPEGADWHRLHLPLSPDLLSGEIFRLRRTW